VARAFALGDKVVVSKEAPRDIRTIAAGEVGTITDLGGGLLYMRLASGLTIIGYRREFRHVLADKGTTT